MITTTRQSVHPLVTSESINSFVKFTDTEQSWPSSGSNSLQQGYTAVYPLTNKEQNQYDKIVEQLGLTVTILESL